MRHNEPLRLDQHLTMRRDVQINASRSFVNNLDPPELIFDALQTIQKLRGAEVCFDLAASVYDSGIVRVNIPCTLH